jgi:hypothetical protein
LKCSTLTIINTVKFQKSKEEKFTGTVEEDGVMGHILPPVFRAE